MTDLECVDAHAMEDRVAQDAGIVDHAVELAEAVDRGLDDLAGGNCLGDGFEIRYRNAAALLDLIDDLFRGRRTRSRTVSGTARIVDHHLGALGRAEQCDFLADAAPGAGNDDDFILQ